MRTDYGSVRVSPVTGTIGAEVDGVRIGGLDGAQLADLTEAWLDWKVLFFREQDVTTEEHIEFGRQFGDLEVHPFLPNDGRPEIVVLDTEGDGPARADKWHVDVSFRACPPMGSILRGRIVPAVGGDTLWADMERAYELLDDSTKERIEHLTATHTLRRSFGKRLTADELERKLEEYPDQHHPLVRVHPVTGRRSLMVSQPFISHVDDLERDESDALLDHLHRQADDPSVQVRFRWRADSFAMWDNRCTQHRAAQDFAGRRRMERVTLLGDVPIGTTGTARAA